MKTSWMFAGAFVVAVIVGHEQHPGTTVAQPPPLDYTRPIYVKSHVILCPRSTTYIRPKAFFDLFESVWSLDDKAEAIGCVVVWQEGMRIADGAKPMPGLDGFTLIPPGLVTDEQSLTNTPPSDGN